MEYEKKYKNALEWARQVMNGETGFIRNEVEEIFPELKELEDERIREKVITTIHLYYGEPLEDEAKEMIAWLEKQGEHANFRNKIQVGDKVTRNEDGVLVNLSQLKRVAKKQGEQKKELFQELDKKLNDALENETTESLEKFLNEQCIQYASIESGIKAHAEDYSFNIESELFNQLTKEQQALWRKEIEQACINGGYNCLDLAKDPRYKENLEVKEPVSEELNNAAVEWFNSVKYKSDLSGTPIEGFKTGAQWQLRKTRYEKDENNKK